MADPTMALMDYLRNMGLEPGEGFLQATLRRLMARVIELQPLLVAEPMPFRLAPVH